MEKKLGSSYPGWAKRVRQIQFQQYLLEQRSDWISEKTSPLLLFDRRFPPDPGRPSGTVKRGSKKKRKNTFPADLCQSTDRIQRMIPKRKS
jgi:hypothetical protein